MYYNTKHFHKHFLIFTRALWNRFHYSQFTGKETEVQEYEVTYAKSHSLGEAEPGTEPRSSKFKASTLFKERQLSLEIDNCKILSLKGSHQRHISTPSHSLRVTELISSKAKSRHQKSLNYSADP